MERQFFNQSQPQTMQAAVFLLYANVLVALLFRNNREGLYEVVAISLTRGTLSSGPSQVIGVLVAIGLVVGSAFAAYLIANEKKVGWRLGVVVAVVPVASIVLLIVAGYPGRLGVFDALSIPLLFDVALLVLLLHEQTRSYEKIWFK